MLIFSTSFVAEKINMVKGRLLPPSGFRGLFGDLGPLFGRHACCSRPAAHAPQRHRGGVLAVLGRDALDLAGRNLGNHDGVADGIGGTLLAFGTSGHSDLLDSAAASRHKREDRLKPVVCNYACMMRSLDGATFGLLK